MNLTETKFPLAKAYKVANYILELLQPHCQRIHIAGSIRRCAAEVKDIEIVCEPKQQIMYRGIFHDEVYEIAKEFTAALKTITSTVIKGSVEGRYMQIATTSKNCPGIILDLFMPRPEDYWRQYAIRTGSADYAHYVIAAAWSRKGWVGINGELYKRSECDSKMQSGKRVYTLPKPLSSRAKRGNLSLPPVWKSEADFFLWLDLPYMDPEHRIVSISNEAL